MRLVPPAAVLAAARAVLAADARAAAADDGSGAAMVVASRGGGRLGRALASVAWASERLVLDPARRLATRPSHLR